MITREQIIAEARTWVGTPFHAQAHLKGVGVDCVGLVRGIARELGIVVEGRVAYPMRPDGTLEKELQGRMTRVTEAAPADVLLMSFGGEPHHVAIFTGSTIIHAHMRVRRCVEQSMTPYWWSLTRGIFRYDGITIPGIE